MPRFFRYILSILLCESVGAVGSLFTMDKIPTWFVTLEKPFFSPPNWVFGPVWITLYALMGIAAAIVWESKRGKKRDHALAWFGTQLALNAVWTPVFFGAERLDVAFLVIVAMVIAIIGTIVSFKKISKAAAWMLAPYLAWVSFATALNFALWILNA